MKKIFALLAFVMLFVSLGFAQGQRYDSFTFQRIGPYVAVAPHATVTVCGYPASMLPGSPCTNTVTTYKDQTLTTTCPAGQQVTLPGTNACQAFSDNQGNFGVWLGVGLYSYTVTYNGATYGPYYMTLGSAGGVPSGRAINTTSPLNGGGTLLSDLTLSINNFAGDLGTGGAAGAVPAPAAGDAAAGKVLGAGGGWVAPSGVPATRTIGTTLPLVGGGDLSANRTLSINNFVGDSGSGGQAGAVPAPVAGDGAALKVLGANGSWLLKVAPSRQILTTAPLTGGGNLGGDLTLAINNFGGDSGSGGTAGAVPAPGAGDAAAGKVLGANGGWVLPPAGGLNNFINAASSGSIQNAITTACAASPIKAVYIDPQYTLNESYSNTCNAVVYDARHQFNSVSGTLNVRNFGADGTGIGYVNMVTNSASHNVSGCWNMTTAVVGKYLHVLRAGPSGGIFKSLITGLSGSTCTVADFPTASVTAGGWVSSNDDDAPAIQAAIDLSKATGAKVVIPPGQYFLLSPLKLPLQQSSTTPWNVWGIHIEGEAGAQGAQLFYVQNAKTGPPRAVIEGPTTRTATTGWSQTGTTVTVTMASNPYVVNDFIDFWSPTAGHLNSGDYSTGNTAVNGITGGWVVTAVTSTTVQFSVDTQFSQTASATEVGEISRMSLPVTPWIERLRLSTLDYPSGTKNDTFLANGIDFRATLGFRIANNYFGNLGDGIRLYRSWLGTIRENEFQGPNIPIHFPRNLGPINSVRVEDNNLEACYGIYGLLMEANQEGGSYENTIDNNEFEGTCQNTRADIVTNSGGLTYHSGYYETAGSHETTYTNLVNNGYGVFNMTFPLSSRMGGGSTIIAQATGGGAQSGPNIPNSTLAVVAGAGTFPAGRDVYINTSVRNSTTGWESNATQSQGIKIVNTALNDEVQVSQTLMQDWTQGIDQFCVWEADVPTGNAAPALGTFKKGNCGAIGTPINVTASTTGVAMASPGWAIETTTGNTFIGVPPTMVRTTGSNQYFSPYGINIGPIQTNNLVIGGSSNWTCAGGSAFIGGTGFGCSNQGYNGTSRDWPTDFSTGAVVPFGTFARNNQLYQVPTSPINNAWGWVCVGTGVGTNCQVPTVASEWRRIQLFSNTTVEGTAAPTTQTWSNGDYVRNTNPVLVNMTMIKGWMNGGAGTPGSWKADYIFDPTALPPLGTVTPNSAIFTTETVNNVLNSPGQNNMGNTQVVGSSVNPLNVAGGPLLLFDATDGTSCTTNGASVSTWTDQSTGHYNATPQGTSVAPTCTTNALNGQNAVTFNGTTQGLGNSTFPFGSTNNGSGGLYAGETFFVVMKVNGASPASGIVFVTGADNWLDMLSNNTMRCWLGNGGAPESLWIQDTTSYHVWECDMNAGGSNTAFQRKDGTQVSTYISTNRAWTDTGFGLGGTTAGTSQRTNISIAYAVLYGSVLSSADRQTVATYLQNRFAINMANDYNPAFTVKQNGVNKAYVNSTGQLSSAGSTGGFVTLAPQTSGLASIAGGPVFVCDPSAQSYTNGQSVTTCTDTGSGGHNATNGGTAPIFTTGVFAGGQKPSIHYNGTGYLQTATFTLNAPSTICGVVKPTQRTGSFYFWDGFTKWSAAQSADGHVYTQGNGSANTFGQANYDLQPRVWCTVNNATVNPIGYQDGIRYTFGGGESSWVNLAGVTLGSFADGTSGFTGDMGIVAVWNSALSQADITNVQNAMLPWVTVPVTTYDASISNTFNQTLTANYTSGNILNGTPGQIVTLNVCQDATGGWTYTPPPNSVGMATIPGTASGCWGQSFQWDGTSWKAKSGLFGITGKAHSNGTAEGFTNVAYSATPTFDASKGNVFKMTLTGNVTSATLSNASVGQPLHFIICLDAVGSETFVWPTNMTGTMTIGTTASKCNAQSFVYDGTNAVATTPGVTNQ